MITKFNDIFGKQQVIKHCIVEDVATHFAKIKEFIPEDEALEFYLRMEECVTVGTAFAIEDDSCFLYYKNYNQGCAVAVALFGKDEPVKMMTLFSAVFMSIDVKTFKIDFKLHPGKLIGEYKSIVTMISMRRSKGGKRPLVIRVDTLKQKVAAIYERRGITP